MSQTPTAHMPGMGVDMPDGQWILPVTLGEERHAVCEYDLAQSVNSLRDVEAERDLLRKIMYELTLEINSDYNGYCRYCGDDLNIEDEDAAVFYSDEPERHKADCPWRLAAEYIERLEAQP